MANIFISYYKIQEIGLNCVQAFWDALFQEFVNCGNNVLAINTAYFNSYTSNETNADYIDSYILSKVENFAPDIIIAFNNRIPKCILEKYNDVPTVIWDGDELKYFCDLNYIKENIKRFKLFSIAKKWKQDYLDFGFKDNQIYYVPPATAVHAANIEQNMNISFLGAIHYNSGELYRLLRLNTYNTNLKNIMQDYLDNANFNYLELYNKYFVQDESLYPERDFKIISGIQETDLVPLFDFRVITLINLLDLGLTICGHRWQMLAKIIQQLGFAYDPRQVWSLKENEEFFNSSKISISPIHPQARGSGFPWRVFDIMASNACLVCEQSSDLKELTKNYVKIPMFHTPWEARDICKELLQDDKARKEIVEESHKYIDENARWIHRFKNIEEIMNIKLIHTGLKGTFENVTADEEFLSLCERYKKESSTKKIKLKDKIRLKIWNHLNTKLKKKHIIK